MKQVPLEMEVATLLNQRSMENASNTPDYVLARYLLGCLSVFNEAVNEREVWHGRKTIGPRKTRVCKLPKGDRP